MADTAIKFYSKAYGATAASTLSTTTAGSIVFDKTSKSIFVNGIQYGGSNVADASFADNVLKIWKVGDATATPSISLDFSSLATTKSVMAVFNEIANQITVTNSAGEYISGADKDYVSSDTLTSLNTTNNITPTVGDTAGDSVATAITKLDNKGKQIVEEIISNEKVIDGTFTKVKTATGLADDMTYSKNTTANYINNATSLNDADVKLDAAIKAVADTAGNAVTDVKVGDTSVVTNHVANVAVDGTYNASTNKVATQSTVSTAITGLTGSATIASNADGVVTLKTGVSETDGKISNVTGTDITLAKVATTGAADDVTIADASNKITATTVEGALTELATSIENNALSLADGEKIIGITDKKISSTLTINIEKQGEGDAAKDYIVLKGKDGAEVSKVDASQFVKDGMIDTVAWKKDGEADTNVLLITWNTDAGKTATEVDMSKFIDTYTSGNTTALTVSGNVITPVTGAVAENAGTLTTGGQVYTAVAATKGQDIQTITGETAITQGNYVNVKVTATKGADNDNYTLSTTSAVTTQPVSTATADADGLATAKDVKDYVDGQVGTAVQSVDGSATEKAKTVTASDYATVKVSATTDDNNNVTLDSSIGLTVQGVEGSDADNKGLAEASDVKNYVDAHKATVTNNAATITANAADATTLATVDGTAVTAKVAMVWDVWE